MPIADKLRQVVYMAQAAQIRHLRLLVDLQALSYSMFEVRVQGVVKETNELIEYIKETEKHG